MGRSIGFEFLRPRAASTIVRFWILALLFGAGTALLAADQSPDKTAKTANSQPAAKAVESPMTRDTRYSVIRGLNAEYVFVRHEFPMGSKGLTLKDGQIQPSDSELRFMVAQNGAAARPGDRAQITEVDIREKSIVFEINGGPKKKKKWYQHLEVGGMGGTTPVAPDRNPENPHGSYVTLAFDRFVPDIGVDQLKKLLAPVFNFTALSAAQAYLETLPPKVQQAIKSHQVLVGMNRQMVDASKGRPDKKIREKDEQEKPYEEWIYGEPPQEVSFIRLVGDQVTRVEVMKVDGEKVVRTEREVEVTAPSSVQAQATGTAAPATPPKAPSLRRPGEDATGTTLEPQAHPGSSSPQPPQDPPHN